MTNFRKKADVAVEGSLKSSKRTFNASKPKGGPSMSTPTHYIDIYGAMGGVPQAQIEAYRAPPREWMTGRWPAGRASHDPPPIPSECPDPREEIGTFGRFPWGLGIGRGRIWGKLLFTHPS